MTEEYREIKARPTRLKDGTWGAWTDELDVSEGDTVLVCARNGKSWEAIVTSVVFAGSKGCILKTRGIEKQKIESEPVSFEAEIKPPKEDDYPF